MVNSESSERFRILTVCTGNVCRSPAAQLLLARELGPSVHVESAGTGALVGSPVEPSMAALLLADGISTKGFAARALTGAMVKSADLILTATRQHRAAVVELAPSTVRRTFTLRELARILEMLSPLPMECMPPAQVLRELLRMATQARSELQSPQEEYDVSDPFGQGKEEFARAMRLIRTEVRTITTAALSASSTKSN